MKVLQINAVSGSGSTGRICTDIAEALKNDGHEVRIVYGNGNSTYPQSIRVGSDISVKINAAYARISGLNAHAAFKGTTQVFDIIESFSPDIVHLHNLHANYVNIKRLLNYLGKNNIATVITLHDCWPFTGKCTHYSSADCRKWESGCCKCPKLKDDIPSLFFDRTHRMWKEKELGFEGIPNLAIIGVSDWITNEAKRSFLRKAKIIKRIYNWIDLDIFAPESPNGRLAKTNNNDKFTIFCASAGWKNGSDRLKDLLGLAEIIDSSMQIVVAGKVDEAVTLPQNVIAVGYISNPTELAEYYRNADVYVHFSREDTFGKVIAEALACGTPSIVYNSTACPEVVGENCGYVVECGDIYAIADKCEEINKNGKEAYSIHCSSTASARFDKTTLINETMKTYKKLLK